MVNKERDFKETDDENMTIEEEGAHHSVHDLDKEKEVTKTSKSQY